MPALYRANRPSGSTRASEAKRDFEKAARSAINLANGVRAAAGCDALHRSMPTGSMSTPVCSSVRSRRSPQLRNRAFDAELDATVDDFERASRAVASQLSRTRDLSRSSPISKARATGSSGNTTPTGFRVLLRSAYQVFGRNLATGLQARDRQGRGEIEGVYQTSFGLAKGQLQGRGAARVCGCRRRVLLGQTIALDLKGSWWSRWWQRRRGYSNYAMDFAQMIEAETLPIIDALRGDNARATPLPTHRDLMTDFLSEQEVHPRKRCWTRSATRTPADLSLGKAGGKIQRDELERTVATLEKLAA